jgi:hypothetical protein
LSLGSWGCFFESRMLVSPFALDFWFPS